MSNEIVEVTCSKVSKKTFDHHIHGTSYAAFVPCVHKDCEVSEVPVCRFCVSEKKSYVALCPTHANTCLYCNNERVKGNTKGMESNVPGGWPEVYTSTCIRQTSSHPMRHIPCMIPFTACYHCRLDDPKRGYLCPEHYENVEEYTNKNLLL